MDDIVVMNIFDPLQYLFQDRQDDDRIGDFFLFPQDHQLLTGEVLHNNNVILLILIHFLKGVDILWFDGLQNTSFL